MAKSYRLLKEVDETEMKTPQVKFMLKTWAETFGVDTAVSNDELVTAFEEKGLVTKQGADKVLRFYEARLKELGYIEITGGRELKEASDGDSENSKPTKAAKVIKYKAGKKPAEDEAVA